MGELGRSAKDHVKLPNEADWRENWEFIDQFIREWLGLSNFRRPSQDSEIEQIEKRLSTSLPDSAKEWVNFAFASEQIENQFSFRDCLEIERRSDHDAISILVQGEDDFFWAIKACGLENSDPPISAYYLDYDDPDECFVEQGPWAPSLTTFAFDYLLTYLHPRGGTFSTRTEKRDDVLSQIAEGLVPVSKFGHLNLIITEDMIAFTSDTEGSWHRSAISFAFRDAGCFRKSPDLVKDLFSSCHVRSGPLAHTQNKSLRATDS